MPEEHQHRLYVLAPGEVDGRFPEGRNPASAQSAPLRRGVGWDMRAVGFPTRYAFLANIYALTR